MKHTRLKMLGTILLCCVLSACTGDHAAQSVQQGQAAFKQQNYPAAFKNLLNGAKAGNSNAQYAVGYMYYNGLGVKRNQTKALKWFNRAAKKGNYRALSALDQLDRHAEQEAYTLPKENK